MHPAFELIYKGFFLGLITAISFGPIFFSIIETSIHKGVYFAISIAVGVLLSDVFIITVTFYSVGSLLHDDPMKKIIGAVGGFLLLGFGIYHLMKPVPHPQTLQIKNHSHFMYLLYLAKGFLINTINPFVFIYWVSAVSIITLEPEYKEGDLVLFFFAAVCSNFIFDVIKSFLAAKVKHLLTHRTMVIVSRIVGVAIILLGARLLWNTYHVS
jgi:threonine/homoserine/homoserine lactone efflux protein